MPRFARAALLALTAAALLTTVPPVRAAEVGHPFILWTEEEAAAIRKRLESDPAARTQLERTLAIRTKSGSTPTVIKLFGAHVLGEGRADQKAALLKFIGRKPEPLTWDRDPATLKWNEGMPSAGDRHMRDEQTENVLRYDLFYDELTPAQRAGIEKSFKTYIQFHLDGHPPRHPAFAYDRTSWLPNMHWPRPIGTHLMALGMQDRDRIEAMFNAEGGWKWWFDAYVADRGFYMEEFGKFYSNIGSMFFWCEGLEKMGLNQFGYGYTGKNGADFKSFLKANTLDITYPRTDWGGGRPTYGRVTMGDAKGHAFSGAPVQQAIVTGYLPNGKGGHLWASNAHMNGPMAKFREPFWFEAGHAQWPDDGFDYFMAALRKPDEDIYYPTLLFNLRPIEAAKVRPPAPAPSFVARQRGFAMLKADHSPAYWEGWKPAVALQFARYYVHYVHDCFVLLGYQAYNAPIYVNTGGSGSGYAGGNAWKDSVRGSTGVVVDNLQAQPVARTADGTVGHRYRENLDNAAGIRFAAVRAAGVYPDVDMERILLLADDYLFDAFWLDSTREGPRTYEWQVQSPCTAVLEDAWKPTDELSGGALYKGSKFEAKTANGKQDPVYAHKREFGADPWAVTLAYRARTPDLAADPIFGGFAKRGIGVRVHLAGGPGTTVFAASPPGAKRGEAGATSLIVRRQVQDTVFVALHDPFDGGQPNVEAFETIQQAPEGVAVRVRGTGEEGGAIDDRIYVAVGDSAGKAVSLGSGPESCTFADHAWVRVGPKQVEVVGDVRALSVTVKGSPKLILNGQAATATVESGVLTYRSE